MDQPIGVRPIRGVANLVAKMFHDGLAEVEEDLPDYCLGMLVAGYSAHASQPEVWVMFLDGKAGKPPKPVQVAKPDEVGWLAHGYPHPLLRLFNGCDQDLLAGLTDKLPKTHHATVQEVLQDQILSPVVDAMPFADAIELARYLVEVVKGFAHFLRGPDIVGGPIDVAGVNRHERFKWISRKHYYSPELNLGVTQ